MVDDGDKESLARQRTTLLAGERLLQKTLSVEQSRAIDRLAIEFYGMNSLVLMENAALGCTQWLLNRCQTPQMTTILCGCGNNGGDGLAIARQLTSRGWPCQVILLGPVEKLSHDARVNYNIFTTGENATAVEILEGTMPLPTRMRLARSTVILDALLGTGAGGAPRAPLDNWIRQANACQALRVAIDVPTGIDAENGLSSGDAFRADATLTFVAKKSAMVRADSERLFGQVAVIPIGIPVQMLHEIVSQW